MLIYIFKILIIYKRIAINATEKHACLFLSVFHKESCSGIFFIQIKTYIKIYIVDKYII